MRTVLVATLLGLPRQRRVIGLMAAIAVAVSVGLLSSSAQAGPAAPPPPLPSDSPCTHAAGPFKVAGNQVLDGAGQPFTPYGITVPGLGNPTNPAPKQLSWVQTEKVDADKIQATDVDWCANTVRFQVGQDNLVGAQGNQCPVSAPATARRARVPPPSGDDNAEPAFLTQLKAEVSQAESLGLVVVINDQTETFSDVTYQEEPTNGTVAFWKCIIASGIASNPQVIFDLFNEPRAYTFKNNTKNVHADQAAEAEMWFEWYAGGPMQPVPKKSGLKLNGSRNASYLGMNQLAVEVRDADTEVGDNNVFWVEGPDYAGTFYGLTGSWAGAIHTSGVVYAFHHPTGPHTANNWNKQFGYLTKKYPVVDGEWTNYIPFGGNNACWPDAPTAIPQYLSYLFSKKIGMTGYQLGDGSLSNKDNYADPTVIDANTWYNDAGWPYPHKGRKANPMPTTCHPRPGQGPTNQGAGGLIFNWYLTHNA